METGIIIQARCGSTRLPNKMILPFYEQDNVLSILLKRLKSRIPAEHIIVATTTHPRDGVIEKICKENNISCFRGSEENVLQRFIEAATRYHSDKLIRVCADNPFLDMDALEELRKQMETSEDDYIAFSTSQGTPTIKTHYGFWGEAVTLNALKRIMNYTEDKLYSEHVTNYIYSHPDLFKLSFITIPPEIENKKVRLTLDTEEDFNLQKEIFSYLMHSKPSFKASDVISVIDAHPEYYKIMQEQIQRNSK